MTLQTPDFLSTKTYQAKALRAMFGGTDLVEGAVGQPDLFVVQRGAGANMSVDVLSGDAWIQGEDTARQGMYHLYNDATVNVAVTAAHATLPRIDQVIARIYDSSVLGVSDTPTIEVVAGTATASAQCADPRVANYRSGAAALPNGAIRLADILVPAASSSVVTANIVDRRPHAIGATRRVNLSADQTMTASFATLGNLGTILEVGPSQLALISYHLDLDANAGLTAFASQLLVNGVAQGDQVFVTMAATARQPVYKMHELALGAGYWALEVQGKRNAGTSGIVRATHSHFTVTLLNQPIV